MRALVTSAFANYEHNITIALSPMSSVCDAILLVSTISLDVYYLSTSIAGTCLLPQRRVFHVHDITFFKACLDLDFMIDPLLKVHKFFCMHG